MGVRPADMQIVVQKTQDIHHAKQNVVNRQDNSLASAQNEVRQDVEKKSTMVNQSEETRQNKVKNDEHHQSNTHKRKSKKKSDDTDEKADENKKDVFSELGQHFDMKV